jgi:putative ABC transport system permease protein
MKGIDMSKMNKKSPPRLAAWLLSRISGASVAGDYEEIYQEVLSDYGYRKARSWYKTQLWKSLPIFVANFFWGSADMLNNYLKLAYRNILRHKRYAFLNIFGLAVGLAACLLMASYVIHELSFETMHPNRGRIFRINGRIPMGGRTLLNAVVAPPFGPAAEESIPEVEESVRILRRHNVSVRIGDNNFKQKKMFFAEPEILEIFAIPLLRGNSKTALEAPFGVIIDEALARKYFGKSNPIGKTLRLTLHRTFEFAVTGIMETMPSNTALRTSMIASFSTLYQTHGEAIGQWQSWGMITTFVRLRQNASVDAVDQKITKLARVHLDEDEKDASYYLQPLDKIYINNASLGMNNDLDNSGSITRLYVFSGVALLILIIAAINFINLSTAKIAGRLKEVGIRKTCGALRSHLIKQFLMESLLLTSIAMALGLFLFTLFKPRLDAYLGKTLNLGVLSTPWILPGVAAMILIVGFLAGSYPAVFLSRFQAAVIFRSGIPRGLSKAGLRRILVGVQFFIAGALIICTLVVLKQVRYSETKDLGFDKNNLIVLNNRDAARLKKAPVVKEQILRGTGALEAALVDSFPSDQNRNIATVRTEGQGEEQGKIVQSLEVDDDFVTTMGLKLIAGRNFEKGRISDEQAVLFNARAAQDLGLEDPVGQILFRGEKSYLVVGVLEDWNTNSIHSRIYPTVLFKADESAGDLVIRLPLEGKQEVLSQIREIIYDFNPEQIFDFAYVDDLHLRSYDEERRLASMLVSFCLLTVFVACLGIFGLAAYSTEQRTKEIGIRKVLGSSISGIVMMFSGKYVRWVFAANILAWPVAYFAVNKWLQAFAFRTSIGLMPFMIAGLLTLVVALLSVIFQTFKAALSNPADSLRYE